LKAIAEKGSKYVLFGGKENLWMVETGARADAEITFLSCHPEFFMQWSSTNLGLWRSSIPQELVGMCRVANVIL